MGIHELRPLIRKKTANNIQIDGCLFFQTRKNNKGSFEIFYNVVKHTTMGTLYWNQERFLLSKTNRLSQTEQHRNVVINKVVAMQKCRPQWTHKKR